MAVALEMDHLPGQTPPRPCPVPIREYPPTPGPTLPKYAYTTATWGSDPTYCAGGRQLVGGWAPYQVQLRAQQLPGAQAQAGRPALPRLPRPRIQPARPEKSRPGRRQGCFLPTKAPRRGQENSVLREVGFRVCFLNKTKGNPALPGQGLERRPARARPRRGPWRARQPDPGRAPPGGSQARPLPGTRGRKSAAAGPGRRGTGVRRGGPRGTYGAAWRRRRQQGVRPVPSRPLAPFLSALLAGPPASSLPARAPRARPLRPAPLPSELEPVAAARGFPQCTARRSSYPIPSPRVRPPLPHHGGAPALTPNPWLRVQGLSTLCGLDIELPEELAEMRIPGTRSQTCVSKSKRHPRPTKGQRLYYLGDCSRNQGTTPVSMPQHTSPPLGLLARGDVSSWCRLQRACLAPTRPLGKMASPSIVCEPHLQA
ncbi:translation initiation factor IF-2-like [Camelus ferus]|uniref:Translation initiation factor IF-2-like n=2 Tax=Camelus TaxID=9836 RepID=A0A8B8S476_CAMFR|nr:translation initiation factor IF-2-like [Camelus ferus]